MTVVRSVCLFGDQQSDACSRCLTVVRCISLSVTSGGKLSVNRHFRAVHISRYLHNRNVIQNMYNVKITFIMPFRVKVVKTAI